MEFILFCFPSIISISIYEKYSPGVCWYERIKQMMTFVLCNVILMMLFFHLINGRQAFFIIPDPIYASRIVNLIALNCGIALFTGYVAAFFAIIRKKFIFPLKINKKGEVLEIPTKN